MLVDSVETHEVSANVTVETSAPVRVKSHQDQHLINFGSAVPHDILLGELPVWLLFCHTDGREIY